MFERHHESLLPLELFWRRLLYSGLAGLTIFVLMLGVGMVGYHHLEHMPWVDAFANSSMILSGMGPLMALNTSGGKVFAGIYALLSGLAFTAILGLCFAPVFHRFLHRFHIMKDREDDKEGA